jgi:hypothetical protein
MDRKEEEEEEELGGYATPPSSPTKENQVGQKQFLVPRSLARSTAKKAVRQVQNLRVRVEELRDCQLSSRESFMVNNWNYEFDDVSQKLSKEVEPEENVKVMLNRVRLVYALFRKTFTTVSGVYIGKSVNMRVRFNHHQRQKKKENHMLAMVAIGVFTAVDVPALELKRWRMNAETLALQYERLLTEAVIEEGLEVYNDSEEAGGGGRCASGKVQETTLYMLLSSSNN